MDPADASGQAAEILIEARRVGASGDQVGQVALLEQAGSIGSGDAFYELAKIYMSGIGMPKDPESAVDYLNSAMNLGNPEATRVLGWLYVLGSGVSKDVTYGELLLAKAAETSVRAQREFGMALTNQRPPHLNDMERGLEYLRSAAAAGDIEASKAFDAAFSRAGEAGAYVTPSVNSAGTRENHSGGGGVPGGQEEILARGRRGDLASLYQHALNLSLGRVKAAGDAQFQAYCWYAVAAARGYAPAQEEMRSLAGVRTLADKHSPGRMDACITDINIAIDNN